MSAATRTRTIPPFAAFPAAPASRRNYRREKKCQARDLNPDSLAGTGF